MISKSYDTITVLPAKGNEKMETKTRIGTGAQSEVFLDDTCAIKVFKPGYSKAAVFYEATVTACIEQTGLPIAKVRETILIKDRYAIRYEYIPGKTLTSYMVDDSANLQHYIDIMVNLQLSIFAKKNVLPIALKDRLKSKISCNDCIGETEKQRLLTRLARLPDGTQLCHGDFHGSNILLQDDKPYIIDWIDASVGHPDGDVCRTYMVCALYNPDMAEKYLHCYCNKTGTAEDDILAWLPVVAAARLSESHSDESDRLSKWINSI